MDAVARAKPKSIRVKGRSYVAFVFCPVVPIIDWLDEIDATLGQSPGFFSGKPVVLDLSAVDLSQNAIVQLIASLEQRGRRRIAAGGKHAALAHRWPQCSHSEQRAEEAASQAEAGVLVDR
jgi:septum site-determining protein MinC